MAYIVKATIMDVIDPKAGEYADGRPKVITEYHRGDKVDLASMLDEDRIKELLEAGAIVDEAEAEKAAAPEPEPEHDPASGHRRHPNANA
jgi:hypothetical protein